MYIILMKLINLAITSIWILFGLLTVTCGAAYAQETGQKARQRSGLLPVGQKEIDSYEKLLREADALIRSGKPLDAYALLEPLEFEHAGEVRFDHMIGIAALDSGKPDKATLAFERILAVDPDFPAARFDMGRSYYQMGDLSRAKIEFVIALKQNPSEKARASIDKYLNDIASREAGANTVITGFAAGTVGHDSNVNSSTSQSQIFVDLPATIITLDPTNVKVSDNYYGVAAGAEITHMQNANLGFYAGADLIERGNITQKSFNTLGLDARAGMIVGAKTNRIRLEMLAGRRTLGGLKNYDTTGLKADWRRMFSPSNQLNVFAQYVQYRYADPYMKPNDIDQQAVGLGWLHVLADSRSSLSGSIHYGTENDVSPIINVNVPVFGTIIVNPGGGRNDGAKRFSGIRAGGLVFINKTTGLFSSVGIQVGDYDKVNYYFLRQRHDRFYDLKFGADLRWEKLWALRPQLSFFRNVSNIPVYAYDRMDFSLTVRRDFR